MLAPWLEFHPQLWFLAFTVVYAIERAVTVKARGWKIQLLSVAVFPGTGSTTFSFSRSRSAPCGCGRRTSKSW